MTNVGRVGIIGGAGWLGSAIAKALVHSGTVAPRDLTCSYRSRMPENTIGCAWTSDNGELVDSSNVIILSVRPNDWMSVNADAGGKLVVSVMAGIPVADIKERLGTVRVARALPNAAAEIGFSYTPYFMQHPQPGDLEIVGAIFRSCGEVDAVAEESHIDYFTAMSGSGAAFPALLAEAMMMDAIERGMPAEIARRAAEQVIIGAGRLQEAHGVSPAAAVKSFVDYKGTTAAGIIAMRQMGFASVVGAGLDAACRKAQALSIRPEED